jgi:hypothetical protein
MGDSNMEQSKEEHFKANSPIFLASLAVNGLKTIAIFGMSGGVMIHRHSQRGSTGRNLEETKADSHLCKRNVQIRFDSIVRKWRKL